MRAGGALMRGWSGPLAVALLSCACAPSQRHLLADRHYPEALAAVEEGAVEGGAVLSAIAADLELGLHVEAVSAAQLRAQLPGSPPGFDDLALVRIRVRSHDLTLPSHAVVVELVRGEDVVTPPDTSIAALAERARETLPAPEVVHHAGEHDLRLVQTTRFPLAELLGRVVFNVATVGLLHEAVPIVRDHGAPAYTEVRPPSAEDFARDSPAAAALSGWLEPRGCSLSSEGCERWELWPRVAGGAGLELRVHVELGYAALHYRVPIPAGSLEDGLAALFGGHERRLAQLDRQAELDYVIALDWDDTALTPSAHRQLCQRVEGRRGRPGLRERAGLTLTIETGTDADARARAEALREALITCGLAEPSLHVEPSERSYAARLRVRHLLDG